MVKKEVFKMGVTELMTTYGTPIKVYDKERTICDIIRIVQTGIYLCY